MSRDADHFAHPKQTKKLSQNGCRHVEIACEWILSNYSNIGIRYKVPRFDWNVTILYENVATLKCWAFSVGNSSPFLRRTVCCRRVCVREKEWKRLFFRIGEKRICICTLYSGCLSILPVRAYRMLFLELLHMVALMHTKLQKKIKYIASMSPYSQRRYIAMTRSPHESLQT